jgi:uncharacterized protein
MSIFYLDASAWVKYYVNEPGSDWMDRLWEQQPAFACSPLGPVEVIAGFVRRSRQEPALVDVLGSIVAEVDHQFDAFQVVPISDAVLALSREVIVQHALRGSDAVHLASALRLRQTLVEPLVFVSSDVELLAAARAEGLSVVDPMLDPPLPDFS